MFHHGCLHESLARVNMSVTVKAAVIEKSRHHDWVRNWLLSVFGSTRWCDKVQSDGMTWPELAKIDLMGEGRGTLHQNVRQMYLWYKCLEVSCRRYYMMWLRCIKSRQEQIWLQWKKKKYKMIELTILHDIFFFYGSESNVTESLSDTNGEVKQY